jgi:threonine dehydrogenase-like Zn-dependent dehydrogenase
MRSAVLRQGEIVVVAVDDPVPEFGQVLCRTLACGICGSDLHFVKYGQQMQELSTPMDGQRIDFERDIFMGHEFAVEVVEAGPDTEAPPAGTVVTSLPGLLTMAGPRQLAYSNDYPAGYSEYMLLSPFLLQEVPNGLPAERAALTEPMAVGAHAVAKSAIKAGESAVVLGCGPVGLAVIASLQLAGVETIVAADFSPARRALAATMGATAVVDPGVEPAIEAWRAVAAHKPLVIFEAVGVPGMLAAAMRDAPPGGRVLVVGVCMETDQVVPAMGIMKELSVQFVLGYTPEEFNQSLRNIAEGAIDVAPMITGRVDIGGVPGAFTQLGHPDDHCKIVVTPFA